MGNRYLNQFQYTFERYKVHLEVVFDGNTTSNPILKAWDPGKKALVTAPTNGYRGVKSVTRSGVGIYVVTLQDSWQRLLGVSFTPYAIDESTAPVTSDCYVKAQTTSTVTLVTYGNAIATPVELDANTRVYLDLYFANSTAL